MIRAAFLLVRLRSASGTPTATARATSRTTARLGDPFAPTCGLAAPTETVRGSPCRPCHAFSVRAVSAMSASGSGGSAPARTSVRLCDAIAGANWAAARCCRCDTLPLRASGAATPTVAATSTAVRLATGAAVCAAVAVGTADVDSVADEAADVTAAGTELATASPPDAATDTGVVAAGSAEPTLPAVAAGTASTPADGVDAVREGSKVNGSTYPCGSVVVRAPKYT
jgi:hypothetical protein